jgi:phage-related protein (TIGR01555 family)
MKMFDALMRAAGGAVDRLAHMRMDAWYNGVTGFGTSRDKTTYGRVVGDTYLTDVELANLYHHSDMAARMVDIVPDQVWRKGCEIRTEDAALDEIIAEKMDNLGLERRMADGMRWGRCFGGGAVLVGADDGQDASKPLNPERASDIKYLYDFDRRYLWPLTYYTAPGHQKLGQPETYLVTNQNAGASSQIVVHESRLILFGGATTGREERLLLNSWDASILQRGHEALRQFDTAWKSVEILLTDANQTVIKMAGFADMIGSPDGMRLLQQRGMLTDMYRSVLRAIVVDAGTKEEPAEDFARQATTFADIPQTLDKIMLRLAASVPMPVTMLMGQSPAGMNATGESDFRWFYDGLESTQTREVGPRVRGLVKTWLATKAGKDATNGKTPDTITIKWPPLWSETPLNEAQRRKVIAETDAIQINAQVYTPDEVALVRGSQEGWDKDIVLSDEAVKARETALKADLADLESGQGLPSADTTQAPTTTPGQGSPQFGPPG